jgi:hypothetical protein
MKTWIIGLCIALIFFINFAAGVKDTPADVAKKYLIAMQNNDFELAKKYSTPESAELLDFLRAVIQEIDSNNKQEKVEYKLIGNATVYRNMAGLQFVEIKGDDNLKITASEFDASKKNIFLIKDQNEDWKVHNSKENSTDINEYKKAEEVAVAFSNALNKSNYILAKSFCTEESASFIDLIASFNEYVPDSIIKKNSNLTAMPIGQTIIIQDNATVKFVDVPNNYNNNANYNEAELETKYNNVKDVKLNKINGEWKVVYTKENSGEKKMDKE